ncbi:hypothetical protein Q5P01_005168 [Channa striata]|uniref:Platelet-derived growth factor (PDGF) family profile domain-containing protein n=1 Tax=Channa striata TaxID=64152 RepID=A0AA88SY89_CHASR|nr:hypothetical protein Q5P01_005168 [Channa striata]
MQLCIGLASFLESHLLVILLLQLVPAQVTPPPEEDSHRVMKYMDVYAKSMCQPMEQLVNVEQEFPGEVEYIYIPACVPLKRCSGFCGDEIMECLPTLKRNITVEIQRLTTHLYIKQVELTFVEHQACECRPRHNLRKQPRGVSIENKPRRKNNRGANGYANNPRRSSTLTDSYITPNFIVEV